MTPAFKPVSERYAECFVDHIYMGDRLKLLRAFVQNDVPITQAELDEYESQMGQLVNDLNALMAETVEAVVAENPGLLRT